MQRLSFRHHIIAAFLLFLSVAFDLGGQAVCPGCVTDIPPLGGHGPAPDGSGRRVIYAVLDAGSLNEDPAIITKVQGALNLGGQVKSGQ